MPSLIEQTTSGQTTTKWWSGVLSVQTVMYILGGFVAVVIFWKDSHDNWDETKAIKIIVENKADKEELKSLIQRVGRIYELNDRLDARIDELEKQLEYQRGLRDSKK